MSTQRAKLWDLSAIIAPISVATFVEDYWERRHLYVSRHDAKYFANLFTIHDADNILADSSVDPTCIRVVRNGDEVPLTRLVGGAVNRRNVASEALYEEYRAGATIVIQFLHERCRPLRQLCRSLSSEFSAAFQVNVYITPAGHQQGLQKHYDTHDVFVLQVAGTKRWRIYKTIIPFPLESTPYQRTESPSTDELECELTVEPGDTLYVPRGCLHAAESNDTVSIHLTVGVHTIKFVSLLLGALDGVIEANPKLRRSLPIGFLGDTNARASARKQLVDLLNETWTSLDPDQMLEEAEAAAVCATQPALYGHLLDLEQIEKIDLSTLVCRRRGVVCKIEKGKNLKVAFHGKVITLPLHTEPLINFMMQTESFCALDLPDSLDDAGKLTIVRRLVREGLLTFMSHQSGPN